jgi:hypothetical protein
MFSIIAMYVSHIVMRCIGITNSVYFFAKIKLERLRNNKTINIRQMPSLYNKVVLLTCGLLNGYITRTVSRANFKFIIRIHVIVKTGTKIQLFITTNVFVDTINTS